MCSLVPLDFHWLKDIGIRCRLQIMRAESWHRKLTWVIRIEMFSFPRAGEFLFVNFALQFHERMQQCFWSRRAAWDINIDRDVAVDSFENVVALFEWPAGNRARAH